MLQTALPPAVHDHPDSPALVTRPCPAGPGPDADEQRLADLIRTHRPALLAFATRLVGGDSALAEDIVQETFVRAWRRIDRMTPEQGSVNSWLHRVAYNIAIDGHRMRKVRPTEVELLYQDASLGQSVPDETDRVLAQLVVRDLLASIWPEHRAVVEQVYLKGHTAAEAAGVLGIPVGTVKSRLFYALRTLRGDAVRMGLQEAW
ncbi:RNA polymerase sigma factor [Kineosporia sp. NBRC 101677]|uniref:sigma-70 family RNA polymerase sigma factor n=1 Tax=Kineosporia sp. NBRC 101677 TaxID=3032197 RepID=UPI00249FAAA9|nr:sigma-70 family RNA polymerase sigma factor [Kineosporia sp. NBRC 101677]GLY17202.1 RNA polymerase sigma factor [Kineosporia sp. NBRC 101677]